MRKMLLDSILDLVKCPNWKTCTFMRFPVGALPEIQNWIWKHFSYKVQYNYYSKKMERFGIYLKSKNGFRIVFSNLARKGSGFFSLLGSLFFFANGLYLPTKQPWGSPKFWFWHHILISNYSYPLLRLSMTLMC